MTLNAHRWRAAIVALTVWSACVAFVAFVTLVWMRECSTRTTVMAVVIIAAAGLIASVALAFTGRATAGRVAVIVGTAWLGFYATYRICNLPNAETLEYLRGLGDPSRARDGSQERPR